MAPLPLPEGCRHVPMGSAQPTADGSTDLNPSAGYACR